jgi:hypothetical protein
MQQRMPMIPDWPARKTFALALNLPKVRIEFHWGNVSLTAHGKMWCWLQRYVDAAVFRAGQIDPDWAGPHLIQT